MRIFNDDDDDDTYATGGTKYQYIFNKLAKNRKIFLFEDINKDTATTIVALMLALDFEDKSLPIEFYINSPGGEVEALFAIYDTIQIIDAPVKTVCIGEAASSAAILLASGTVGMRFAAPNSQIMIHQVRGGVNGTGTDIEIEARAMKALKKRLTEVLARHTGQSYRKVYRDCEIDNYMTAAQAKEYGIVDDILEFKKTVPELKVKTQSKRR